MQKLSWKDVEQVADQLVQTIRDSGFEPEYIIGITTGGLIPLHFLAKRFDDIDNVLTVTADHDKNKNLQILFLPDVDLTDKKVLLVDEVTETGTTLREVASLLSEKHTMRELRTATFAANVEKSKDLPDFFILEEKGEWIAFPWEKPENFPKYSPDANPKIV